MILEHGSRQGATRCASGLLMHAHDGMIPATGPDRPSRRDEGGEFEWHTGPTTHTITNIGKTRFEAIEAVWK